MRDLTWSAGEKKIANRVYEAARQAVLAAALAEFKAKAAAADIDGMWAIGDELRQRRRELEDMLDSRYSRRTEVFGRLIVEGYLDEKDLTGLADDKLEEVRRFVSFVRSR